MRQRSERHVPAPTGSPGPKFLGGRCRGAEARRGNAVGVGPRHRPRRAPRHPPGGVMTTRIHFWLIALALLSFGCNRGAKPAIATGPSSPPGWEVRYNATIALARRGSERVKDEQVWENLQEMLDEEQQLRNSRRKLKDGAEVPDEAGAPVTLIPAPPPTY